MVTIPSQVVVFVPPRPYTGRRRSATLSEKFLHLARSGADTPTPAATGAATQRAGRGTDWRGVSRSFQRRPSGPHHSSLGTRAEGPTVTDATSGGTTNETFHSTVSPWEIR